MKIVSTYKPALFLRSIAILTILTFISSCQKVIQLDLNKSDKKYVIEASVTDQPGTAELLLSQTKNFDDNNNFVGVSGAKVTVKEEGGGLTTFTETTPGHYQASNLVGSSGKTYDLNVNVGGQVFTATSEMPVKVNLDTIYTTDENLFAETRKIV